MSDRSLDPAQDPARELDAAIAAWQVPGAPAGFADRVLAAEVPVVLASAAARPRRARGRYVAAAAFALAAAILLAVFARRPTPPASGTLEAAARTTVVLRDAVVIADPGARLRWTTRDGTVQVEQDIGRVFYRVTGASQFAVLTPLGRIDVESSTFEVEIEPMRKSPEPISSLAAAVAAAAAVSVTIYEGQLVVSDWESSTVLEPGPSARLRLEAPDAQEPVAPPEVNVVRVPPAAPPTPEEVASRSWCERVVAPFDDITRRYPFARGKKDVPLDKVTQLLGGNTGTVWAFYDETLATKITKGKTGYTLGTATPAIDPAVVRFLDRAQDVTDVLFADGSDVPRFAFDVTILAGTQRVDITLLDVDGTEITYRNGPYVARPLMWPGQGERGAKVQATGFGRNAVVAHKGVWGLFRVFEEATVDGAHGDPSYKLNWDLSSQDAGIVKMLLAPERADNPLFGTAARPVGLLEVFRHPDLTPPHRLYVDGPSCEEIKAGPAADQGTSAPG